jgi:hypothetical protein
MTAIRELVHANLKALMETLVPDVPGLTVWRNRRAPLEAAPAIAVEDGPQQTNVDQVGFKFHTAQPTIEGYCTAPTDEEIGPVYNDLYRRIVNKVEADPTLGGAAVDCREAGLDLEIVKAAASKQAECFFAVKFDIDYTTAQGDAGAPGPA